MSDIAGPMKELRLALEGGSDKIAPSGIGSVPTVKEISDLHKWVVIASVSHFTYKQIGAMFDITPSYAAQIDGWQHPILDEVRQKARDRMMAGVESMTEKFKVAAVEALDKTISIMRTADASNARLAAKDLMDRAGYAPVKKIADVSKEAPAAEFVQAVATMTKAAEVLERKDEWAWKPPVKVVEKPKVPDGQLTVTV